MIVFSGYFVVPREKDVFTDFAMYLGFVLTNWDVIHEQNTAFFVYQLIVQTKFLHFFLLRFDYLKELLQ